MQSHDEWLCWMGIRILHSLRRVSEVLIESQGERLDHYSLQYCCFNANLSIERAALLRCHV